MACEIKSLHKFLEWIDCLIEKKSIQRAIVVLLIAAFLIQAAFSAVANYSTADESVYSVAGYTYWRTRDFRMNVEHPVFLKLANTLPLALLDLNIPFESEHWNEMLSDDQGVKVGAEYLFAFDFFSANKENYRLIIIISRIAPVLMGGILAFFVFLWARELFGFRAGLLSLLLFAFEPNLIAHSSLCTLEIGFVLLMFLVFYFSYRYLFENSAGKKRNLYAAVALFGLSTISRFMAFAFLPVLFILFLLFLKPKGKHKYLSKLLQSIEVMAMFLLTALVFINLVNIIDSSSMGMTPFLLPEKYWYGYNFITDWASEGREGYLLGEYASEMPHYLPLAFLFKVPVGILLLFFASVAFCLIKPEKKLLFLLGPFVIVFVGFSLFIRFYLGIRYLLPIFPFMLVFIGSIVSRENTKFIHGKAFVKGCIFFLATLVVFSTLSVAPNYLAFFNLAVGGAKNGPNLLIDSNLDWGQGLLQLNDFLEKNELSGVKVDYFGWPPAVLVLKEQEIGEFCSPKAGRYAISVSNLVGLSSEKHKCYSWLRKFTPKKRIGYSIYYYEIGVNEVK